MTAEVGLTAGPLLARGLTWANFLSSLSLSLSLIFYLILSERGKGREKKRERNSGVRETHPLVASHMHPD